MGRQRAFLYSDYLLDLGTHRLYLQACGLLQRDSWDRTPIYALVALGRPEAVTALRKAVDTDADAYLLPPGGERPQKLSWSSHLRLHPRFVTRHLSPSAVSVLLIPRCSFLPALRQCSQGSRVIVGRSRKELLHNAFIRLMALASIPMHPSWEERVMSYLEWRPRAGFTLLWGPPPIQFALLDWQDASSTVERLWAAGELPDPPTSASS